MSSMSSTSSMSSMSSRSSFSSANSGHQHQHQHQHQHRLTRQPTLASMYNQYYIGLLQQALKRNPEVDLATVLPMDYSQKLSRKRGIPHVANGKIEDARALFEGLDFKDMQ